jgi:hypothetical protein
VSMTTMARRDEMLLTTIDRMKNGRAHATSRRGAPSTSRMAELWGGQHGSATRTPWYAAATNISSRRYCAAAVEDRHHTLFAKAADCVGFPLPPRSRRSKPGSVFRVGPCILLAPTHRTGLARFLAAGIARSSRQDVACAFHHLRP